MYYNITMINNLFFKVASKIFRHLGEGVAEGGGWGNYAAPERSAERNEAVRSDFVFWICGFGLAK